MITNGFIRLNKNRSLKAKYESEMQNYNLRIQNVKNICQADDGFVFFCIPKTRGGTRSVKRLFYLFKNDFKQVKKADSSGGVSAGHRPRAVGKESAFVFIPKTRGGIS